MTDPPHGTEGKGCSAPSLRMGWLFSTGFRAWWGAAWHGEKGRQAKRKTCSIMTEDTQQLPRQREGPKAQELRNNRSGGHPCMWGFRN